MEDSGRADGGNSGEMKATKRAEPLKVQEEGALKWMARREWLRRRRVEGEEEGI